MKARTARCQRAWVGLKIGLGRPRSQGGSEKGTGICGMSAAMVGDVWMLFLVPIIGCTVCWSL